MKSKLIAALVVIFIGLNPVIAGRVNNMAYQTKRLRTLEFQAFVPSETGLERCG
jgi:hypothetical protein